MEAMGGMIENLRELLGKKKVGRATSAFEITLSIEKGGSNNGSPSIKREVIWAHGGGERNRCLQEERETGTFCRNLEGAEHLRAS